MRGTPASRCTLAVSASSRCRSRACLRRRTDSCGSRAARARCACRLRTDRGSSASRTPTVTSPRATANRTPGSAKGNAAAHDGERVMQGRERQGRAGRTGSWVSSPGRSTGTTGKHTDERDADVSAVREPVAGTGPVSRGGAGAADRRRPCATDARARSRPERAAGPGRRPGSPARARRARRRGRRRRGRLRVPRRDARPRRGQASTAPSWSHAAHTPHTATCTRPSCGRTRLVGDCGALWPRTDCGQTTAIRTPLTASRTRSTAVASSRAQGDVGNGLRRRDGIAT